MIDPIITVAEARLIEQQLNKIVRAKLTSSDQKIIATVRGLALAELEDKLTNVNDAIIIEIEKIEDRLEADLFINSMKAYTIPFKTISEKAIQKLFQKDKKLKLPKLEMIDWQAISYLSWLDKGSNRQYIVLESEGQYTGLRGVADLQNPIKGVCTICNEHSTVHMFTATVKGNGDNYTSYSNYICADANMCNQNISDYSKLEDFVTRNLV